MGNCLVSCCSSCCGCVGDVPVQTSRSIVTLEQLLSGHELKIGRPSPAAIVDHKGDVKSTAAYAQRQLQPLDVIWFRGVWPESKCFEGLGRMRFGDGEWSHCALVVTTDLIKIKNGIKGRYYLWEATTGDADTGADIETGQFTAGVQIRELEATILKYASHQGTRVGWSSLLNNPWVPTENDTTESLLARRKKVRSALLSFQVLFGGVGYDSSLTAIGDSLHCCTTSCCCCCACCRICLCSECARPQAERDASFFCSEFIVRAYQYMNMGIVPDATQLRAESVSPPALNGSDKAKFFVTPLSPFVYVLVT